jgi:hypothetical protein
LLTIHENYKNYSPPRGVRSAIEKLLSAVPEEFQAGLESVVLTNSDSVGKGKTRRVKGRKYRQQSCGGFYHRRHKGERPWIEIVVDNTLGDTPPLVLGIPLIREMMLAGTLFHELGHHLDVTVGSPAPSGEAAAEAWRQRLSKSYLRKHYWYLAVPLKIFLALFGPIIRRRVAAMERKFSNHQKGA